MILPQRRHALGLLLLLSAFAVCSLSPPAAAGPSRAEMGSPGPDFSLPDLQGNQVSLSSLKGKVVLLTFWSIWCGPCRQEMPMLESLYQKYRNEGLEVVGVNIDRDSISSIQDFLKKNRLSFPTLSDSDRNVMKVYRAHFLPTTFVLDRKGTIIEKIVGLRDWSTPESRRSIEKLLKGK